MATASTATTVSLKLLIDTKGKRVLYAGAGKDFVDFFNVQLLPVVTVMRLLAKEGMVGCLANLYKSVENLGDTTFCRQPTRIHSDVPLLLPNTESSTTLGFYRCSYGRNSDCRLYYANDPTSKCPCCSSVMYSPATLVNPPNKVQQVDALEEKVVDVGIKEGVEILKASLQSKTVLTIEMLDASAAVDASLTIFRRNT
ncbi:DUF674 domain-containing protein [Gossypium australe]|uniref:DUF674 domain-containing protein n=1 Tax=Gossypium australe TaxID=47621 RepID=A0A5B6WKT0_9ROSI|nr:DUF674 domain-containing protein [Gossypium australe]